MQGAEGCGQCKGGAEHKGDFIIHDLEQTAVRKRKIAYYLFGEFEEIASKYRRSIPK
jgi:hypothetical protein